MRLKKILALMLAGCMVFGVTACGGGEDSEETTAGTQASEDTEEKKDNEETTAEEEEDATEAEEETEEKDDEMTAEKLFEELDKSFDMNNSTYMMSMEFQVDFSGKKGSIVYEAECIESVDGDYEIGNTEGSVTITIGEQTETTLQDMYTIKDKDGNKVKLTWDADTNEWIPETVEDTDDSVSAEIDWDAIEGEAELEIEDDVYILTVDAKASEIGLNQSIAIFLSEGELEKTDVEITIEVDKETLVPKKMFFEIDPSEINELLAEAFADYDDTVTYSKMEIVMSDFEEFEVTLELPEGYELD